MRNWSSEIHTLIPTVYRALLTNAVSGIGHRIHTTKKKMLGSTCRKGSLQQLQYCSLPLIAPYVSSGLCFSERTALAFPFSGRV